MTREAHNFGQRDQVRASLFVLGNPTERRQTYPLRPSAAPEHASRFWAKVDKTADCWLWTAYIGPNGYGAFMLHGRPHSAHRVAYELVVGPIPEGLVIDHLCRVRACVNPAHMEPVTHLENLRRGVRGGQDTHCGRGHVFDDANTIRRSNGTRDCRACVAFRNALRYRPNLTREEFEARVILEEIGDKRLTRDDVAMTYAFALRQSGPWGSDTVDFALINGAIIDRWSLSALKYIKEKAWKLAEGRRAA